MEINILTTLIVSSLISAAPNLCDDALVNAAGEPITDSTGRTLSRYCEWAGPESPLLETDVCCSISGNTASCELANLRGYCSAGVRMWCSRGEVDSSTGQVTCIQAFPGACDEGFCVQPPPEIPQEMDHEMLCCGVGGCVTIEPWDLSGCAGEYVACEWGMSMADGTVMCFE